MDGTLGIYLGYRNHKKILILSFFFHAVDADFAFGIKTHALREKNTETYIMKRLGHADCLPLNCFRTVLLFLNLSLGHPVRSLGNVETAYLPQSTSNLLAAAM